MDDHLIVQMFRDRDEDALAAAKEKYEKYLTYIANNVLHDRGESEECVSDALLAAWESIPPQNPDNLKTYLGKLTREIAISRWRRNTSGKRIRSDLVRSLDEIEEIVSSGDPDSEFEEAELSREISRFLFSVNEDKRNVFIRRYWFYDPVKSICKRYGFGKSKVLMMLKRTREDLARYLKERGYLK